MRSRRQITACAAAAFVALWTATLPAQETARRLELDRQVYWRELPNGLTYYVQRRVENATATNPSPQRRVLLRLVVKAGSIDEADDQRGLAHVLEHMAFNGSTRFAPGEMVAYFQSLGAKLGPHVNAATTYDYTSYTLDITLEREGALGRAFEAMRDIAGGITLDPAEIDRERGVVIEEWRGRLGASSRIQRPQLAALFGGSLYANREPIGDPGLLQSFPADRLRDFYRQHYRADRMALIVVGNILDSVADTLIGELFSDLPRSAGTRATPAIPPHSNTRFVAMNDAEAAGSLVSISFKRSSQPARTVADFRARLVDALVVRLLDARLSDVAQRPEARFDAPNVTEQPLAGPVRMVTMGALVRGAQFDEGLAALGEEIARIRQHGFSQIEVARAQREVLGGYERVRVDHQGIADTLTRYYLGIEPAPGPLSALVLAKQMVPKIPGAELNAQAVNLLGDANRVVTAIAPSVAGTAPTESALRAALDAGAARRVAPWRPAAEPAPAGPSPARPAGTVRARRELPEIGVTVLTLSNGVEVWLKPTTFGDDLTITASAHGGAALAPPGEYFTASISALLMGLAGAGGLTPAERSARLAGRIVNVSPVIGMSTHGMIARTRPADVDVALDLMSLYFTRPNLDAAALETAKRIYDGLFASQARNPQYILQAAVNRVNSMDHYSLRFPEPDALTRIDLNFVANHYRQLYANAADFTFVVAGVFDVASITPLLTRYIGSLPSTGKPSGKAVDMRVGFPAAVVREIVTGGREPRSQTTITFFADTGLDEEEIQRAHVAASILQSRLSGILREELGATYSVSAAYADLGPVRGYGTISVRYGSAPDNASRLADAVLREVEKLRAEGPLAPDLQAARAAMARALATGLRQNAYWANTLQMAFLLRHDPSRIPRAAETLDAHTIDTVREAFRRYLPLDRYTVVTLMPEAK